MRINVTMWTGIVAFGTAALLAWAAARASRHDARAWRAIALVHAALVVEMVGNFRHRIRLSIARLFDLEGLYAGRRGPQALALLLLAALLVLLAARLLRRMRRASAEVRAAALLTALALALFATEVVSLHQVDGLLYAAVGPLILIAWCWLALGLGTAATALAATGRRR